MIQGDMPAAPDRPPGSCRVAHLLELPVNIVKFDRAFLHAAEAEQLMVRP